MQFLFAVLAPRLAEPRAMEQVVICCAMIMVVFLYCAFEFQNHFDLYQKYFVGVEHPVLYI